MSEPSFKKRRVGQGETPANCITTYFSKIQTHHSHDDPLGKSVLKILWLPCHDLIILLLLCIGTEVEHESQTQSDFQFETE